MNTLLRYGIRGIGRLKWSWRLFYFIMKKLKSQKRREWLWSGLVRNDIIAKMCDEGYWKMTTLLHSGEEYALPGKGGGINSVIRWQQLYWQSPLIARCTDKITVREFVRERLGADYLIPMLPNEGMSWTNPDDINFGMLPNRFVLKLNNGSGMNLLVKDKEKLDIPEARDTMRKWLVTDFALLHREWHYREIKSKIYCEAFLETPDGEPPPDYKIMCSNGTPLFAWVDTDRFTGHKRNVFDPSFRKLNARILFPNSTAMINKPDNWGEMVHIAETLSMGIPLVRIDLYNIKGRIYFGEMTFTSGAAIERFDPLSFSRDMAAKIDLAPFSNNGLGVKHVICLNNGM